MTTRYTKVTFPPQDLGRIALSPYPVPESYGRAEGQIGGTAIARISVSEQVAKAQIALCPEDQTAALIQLA